MLSLGKHGDFPQGFGDIIQAWHRLSWRLEWPLGKPNIVQNIVPYLYYLYAVILLGGGAMGSKVSGKPSSIIGSAVFAAIAVAAAVLARSNPRAGFILGLVDTLAVTAFFIYRYMEAHKPMPAFPAIGMSVILAILTGIALMNLSKAATS